MIHFAGRVQLGTEMAVIRNVFLLLLGLASLLSEIHAEEYVVGGELEWTFPPAAQSTWYSDVWAKPINFKVGDILVFTYARLHSVCELGNETDFLACAPNPIAFWNSGSTKVTLSKAGAHYFICGSLGHCDLGMKLKVNVESAVNLSPGPAASPASSVSTSVPAPAPTPVFTPAPVPAATTPSAPAPTSTPTSAPTNSKSSETPPPASSSSPPAALHYHYQSVTITIVSLSIITSSLLFYNL